MSDESLLTDEVRAFVGRATEPVTVRITRGHVRRAMLAVTGDASRIPADGEIVPGYVLAALDGDADLLETPRVLPSGVLVGTDWAVERPLRMGDEFTAVRRIADVSERLGGRYGHTISFRVDVEYRDADGALVARASLQTNQFDPANARPTGDDE